MPLSARSKNGPLPGLQSGWDFVIPDKQEQATESSDFELITWLVIKSWETDG